MIVELTKEFKHNVYKRALEVYNETNVIGMPRSGICLSLYKALVICCGLQYIEFNTYEYEKAIKNFWYINPYENLKVWEEVYKCKPSEHRGSTYWFELNDTQSRVDILESAIKETLPTNSN